TIARIGVWTSGVKLWSDTVRKQLHLGGAGPLTASELSRARTRRLVDRGPVVSLSRAYEAEGNIVEAGRISSLLSRKEEAGEEHVRRNFPKAAEWFRLAYRESPREATAPFFLGLCMEEMGNPSEALPLYQKIAAGDMLVAPDSQFTILDVYLQMGLVATSMSP